MFGDKPKQFPQHVALVMVPEFTMMPVTSAIEPLRIANRLSEKALYKWTMHSVDGKPVAASNGILAMVEGDLASVPEQATIIVCGGLSIQHHADKRLIAWLRKVARRGVDIGAMQFIHQRLLDLRDQGLAILLVSSDVDEILALSDRILVMYEGRLRAELDPDATTEEELGMLMGGGTRRGEGE